ISSSQTGTLATTLTTKVVIAAAGINAFLGFNGVGVQVSNANLGVVIITVKNNGTPDPTHSGYALTASGGAALVGISALSVSGSLSVQTNTIQSGTIDETVQVPDPANPGQNIPVTIHFTGPLPL